MKKFILSTWCDAGNQCRSHVQYLDEGECPTVSTGLVTPSCQDGLGSVLVEAREISIAEVKAGEWHLASSAQRALEELRAYKMVRDSRGTRRSFILTVGLQEGYDEGACVHDAGEVVSLIENHLKGRAAAGNPYLTGTVTKGQVVYAWPEGPGKAGGGHEPQAAYSGEVSSLYNAALSDDEVKEILNDLAAELGRELRQTRIYVAYRDEVWVIQREGAATPTGETVSLL